MFRRLIAAWLFAVATAYAQPAVETATTHYQRGVRLMTESPKDYAAAAREFEQAHALAPDPKYVYNLALAQRLGGDCRSAIENYRAYLATDPPEVNATNANIGIERCEQTLATQPKPEPPEARPVEPRPADTAPVDPRPPAVVETPRGRDGIGTTLAVSGGVFVAASLTFYLLARDAAAETHDPGPLPDFEAARDRANGYQGVSIVTGVIGAGLVTAGIIRLATRPSTRTTLAVSPTQGGGAFAIGGRF